MAESSTQCGLVMCRLGWGNFHLAVAFARRAVSVARWGFPGGVLSKGGVVADGWGVSEGFLRELALGGGEFVDDLVLSYQ